jgi:integrase
MIVFAPQQVTQLWLNKRQTMIQQYRPARLVKGHRWYIVYYQMDPFTHELIRYRETYSLNRIKNIKERTKYAKRIISQINALLPSGWPFKKEDFELPRSIPIVEALQKGLKIKTGKMRNAADYRSHINILSQYLKENKMDHLPIGEFSELNALEYMDHVEQVRKVGPQTYNNYKQFLRSLFNELLRRKYIETNPFVHIQNKKVGGKKRRAFNDHEKSVVADHIHRTRPMLMLAILLQYHCFIRPRSELLRLRFHHFDLQDGLLRLPASITKNKEDEIVTIPNELITFIFDQGLHRYSPTWFVFGPRLKPHPDRPCGRNYMGTLHKNTLELLHEKGLLEDIGGLTFYSWKDTGALELFRSKVNVREIMRQLRHKSLETTQRYGESLYTVNKEIKGLNNRLL